MVEEFLKLRYSNYRKWIILFFFLFSISQAVITQIWGKVFLSDLATFDKMILSNPPEIGSIFVMILMWILPLWLIVIYNDILIKEFESGIYSIYITKNNAMNYYKKKIKSSFVISFFLILTFLLINFFVWEIIDFNNDIITSTYLDVTNPIVFPTDPGYNELIHPYFTMIKKIFTSSFLAGILSINITNITYIFKERKYVYVISFFSWYYLLGTKFINVALATQPYVMFESGINYGLRTTIVLTIFTFIFSIFTFNYIKKKDEI